jgi:hypothetical protein
MMLKWARRAALGRTQAQAIGTRRQCDELIVADDCCARIWCIQVDR